MDSAGIELEHDVGVIGAAGTLAEAAAAVASANTRPEAMRRWEARNSALVEMVQAGRLSVTEVNATLGIALSLARDATGDPTFRRQQEGVKTLDQFLAEFEPPAYIVEPIIRTGSLYSLTARTGHGKTGFLISACLAVATGREDALGRSIHQGRVVYLALENPDDIRMRFMVAADRLSLDRGSIANEILIIDMRCHPEDVFDLLAQRGEAYALVIVDTFAAMFDGNDTNDAVQGGEFMRRLRPLTQLPGRPAVLVACHPVKNAPRENLLPYGSGAILNEVDGNLVLWKEGDVASLHWQGKLRGLEFAPATFRFVPWGTDEVRDVKGKQVIVPVCRPADDGATEDAERAAGARDLLILRTIVAIPEGTQREWSDRTGIKLATLSRSLAALGVRKLLEQGLDRRWRLTDKGWREVEKMDGAVERNRVERAVVPVPVEQRGTAAG